MHIPDNLSLEAAVKAVLFASSQPVGADRLAAFFETDTDTVLDILSKIENTLASDDSGVRLVCTNTHYRLATKTEYGELVAAFLDQKRASFLSNAALETLAVAAYNQPVTRTYISQIRGVSSSEIVESLVEKGLLEENGRLDLPGRPMSYVTTDKFLTVFGLSSLDDLPKTEPPEEFNGEEQQLLLDENGEIG